MVYFKGRSKINEVFDHIVAKYKETSGSGWTIYYESNDKLVLRSVGSGGSDRLYFILEPGNSREDKGSYLEFGIASGVSTVDGSVPPTEVAHMKRVYVHKSDVDTELLVNFELSMTEDRIIAYLEGDVHSVTGLSVMCYTGLLNRYSPEKDSDALCIGVSYLGDKGVRTLRDLRDTQVNNIYLPYAIMLPVNPGWGNLYHMSPCIYGNQSEGARGELFDLYHIPTAGVSHGDEIYVGNKVFRVYSLSVGGNTFLPSNVVAAQMI